MYGSATRKEAIECSVNSESQRRALFNVDVTDTILMEQRVSGANVNFESYVKEKGNGATAASTASLFLDSHQGNRPWKSVYENR
jgi:hypothetical protein